MLIKNVTLVTHREELKNHWLKISDGEIADVGVMGTEPQDDTTVDASNLYALPGAIDIHVHGAMGANAMDADAEFFEVMSKALVENGTTSYLMTTMTESFEHIRDALANIKNYECEGGAELVGIHLEGPFINAKYKGAQNSDFILEPDAVLMEECINLADDQIKIVTYAPEHDLDNSFLELLVANDIIPSVGHSDATYERLVESEKYTKLHLTHFYNGMRGLHHREAGIVGYGMMHEPFVELICDGIHVSADVIRLTYKTIGPERLMIITDAMHAQGLKDGVYSFGGQDVELKNGEARLTTGSLAGSVVTMKASIKNVKEMTGCSWSALAQMSAYNQAQRLKLTDRGVLESGKRADIALYDEAANLVAVFAQGVQVFGE